MHVRFRWTFLLTLVAASLVAAPLAVTAADLGTGLTSFGVRGSKGDSSESDNAGATPSSVIRYDRSFAPVMEGLGQGARSTAVIGSDWVATASGFVRLSRLNESPRFFAAALDTPISKSDVALVHFGDMSMDSVRNALQMANVTPLGEVPNNAIVVTGVDDLAAASLARAGATVLAWTPAFFTSPKIGVSPVLTAEMAGSPTLSMRASIFPGTDESVVTSAIEAMGGSISYTFNGLVSFSIDIDDLRAGLDTLTGLNIRALHERGTFISQDEDTAAGIQIAEWRGGDRPYTEAGIDGTGVIIGITDTGLSLDAAVLSNGTAGIPGSGTADPAGPGHRKVVSYTTANGFGGNGDLLTCDGISGATHGHVVASIAAGNASEILVDIRSLSGFEPNIAGTGTTHAIDGVAPGAKVYFIDDQVASACVNPEQIEAQQPGTLSANVAASTGAGAKIHNFSFATDGGEATYSGDAQDLDMWLTANQDYLVVVAAGNAGSDANGDGNLEFGTVTAPGTAKNVLTVGSSGYPNNPLDPENGVIQQITNNGIEIISRFTGGGNGSGQGPAAFTSNSDGGFNWRIKPDVMAPGDETLGNQRLTSPTTCISGDNDQAGPVECSRLLPGVFEGTSFAAAAASGAAALVVDYFSSGYAPAGQAGGAPVNLSGPELKAAMIASADLMTGQPQWRQLGGQLQLAFYNPRHLSTFTPEQGYGRVQLNKLLPLNSEPGTPTYISTESVNVPLATTVTRTFSVVHDHEPMRCAASWYDKEATLAGLDGQEGNLVRNLDMEVRDCGADSVCNNLDDTLYYGNYFSEDTNFDRFLLEIPAEFVCSNDSGIFCDPGAFDPLAVCGLAGATCVVNVPAITEDCNSNGILDFSEYSLPVSATMSCPGGGRDVNNSNEAVFLSTDQLTAGHTMQVSLRYAGSTEGVPAASVQAGLVCTGGIAGGSTPDAVRLNKPEYTCADSLVVTATDPGGSTGVAVGGSVTVQSFPAGGGLPLDTESGLIFSDASGTGTVFDSLAVAVVDSSSVPPSNNDLLVGVETGGSIVVTYGSATATATVRCTPSLTINNIGRRGTNANFGIGGGCDPRGRIDPRIIVFGLIPGTGSTVNGDLFLDQNEDLTYQVAFTNQEEGGDLLDVKASLKACMAGSIQPDGSCTPAAGINIVDPNQSLGSISSGKGQLVSFNVHVASSVAFPNQIQMVFGVSAAKNGLPVASETVFNHVLNADTWSFASENPADSGAYYYSTDFPAGGREIRNYGGEWYDPLDAKYAPETMVFQDLTTAAFGGGNAQILGFNSGTGKFDTLIANNMPWTFDLNDEGFGARRRFDSDAGDNQQLQLANVWQWQNTGECGFQSNDGSQTDGQGGTGGIWHSGHAESTAPPGRTGFDLGCENYDLPGSADPKREQVIDTVSSPIFFRVHQNRDANGFAYNVEFLRLGLNQQFDVGDGNVIFGYELDPDTTTSQPVDPLDFGWLQSDQGTEGFLSGTSQLSYVVFNPNDPQEVTSAAFAGIPLNATPGPGQNIRSIQGPGSAGSFFDPNDPNKAPARSYGEISGVLDGAGRGLSLTWRRGAGGFPIRNTDLGFEVGAGSFEDIYGPNETRSPAQTYPITAGNPEVLVNSRDSYQVNVTAILRENPNPSVTAVPSYGVGFDDVVAEWREIHPVADRTPCSDPSTWAYEDQSGTNSPIGGSTTCVGGANNGNACSSNAGCPGGTCTSSLASGCAVISWDRTAILSPEDTLTLSVIDTNAGYGPDGIAGTGDEQALDSNLDGFLELTIPVSSDADLSGELITLVQVALGSPVYAGTVAVSSTKGLSSSTDGTIFIQENGDGTSPTTVSAQYTDLDINVAGGPGALAVPCPDNPRIASVNTQFVGTDVAFVTATISDVGPNSDFDLIADPGETIEMGIVVINSALDVNRAKPDLEDVSLTLVANPSQIGDTQPIACILDGESFYGTLASGLPKASAPGDPFRWVVGNVSRGSVSEVLQAQFRLGISGRYVDSLGVERRVTSFATPQSFAINLDLDIASVANPLTADSACVGGDNAGRACTGGGDCPNGTCTALPAYLQTGGSSVIAGEVGYFEGFEGGSHANIGTGSTYNYAGNPIAGTSFEHYPAIFGSGGYLNGGVLDFQPGPLSPVAVAGKVSSDSPQGSSAVDGSRCQYNDPRGPSKHPRSEGGCRPWAGSAWHIKDTKAFSGSKSLYSGVEGIDLGADESFDGNHTNALMAAFSGTFNVGVAGGATLSVSHIVQTTDDRTFNVPAGNAAGRGYLEWAEVDPDTGVPVSGWNRLNGFQNNYGNTGVTPFFTNCVFDAYDDFYSAPQALGTTPGFDINRVQDVGVQYNADEIGSEDDYFDPNDPLRLFGPSGGCYPRFVFASLGDYTSTDTANAGKAFTDGELGETGSGVWVKSLFNLDQAAGRTIRVRFTLTDIDISAGLLWSQIFGNALGNAFRGWILDDVAVSGLVDAPIVLAVDTRTPGVDACPEDPNPGTPDNEAACNVVTASAGTDVLTPVSGSVVTLDASASSADSCVNGHLEYQWRIGGSVIQKYSTNPSLIDAPLLTTEYTVDVRCSVDKTCNDADSVLVVPADELEASGQPGELMTASVTGGNLTLTAYEPGVVANQCDLYIFGVQVSGGGGQDLREVVAGGSAAEIAAGLRSASCVDGQMSRVGGTAQHTFIDSAATAAGDIDGYMSMALCNGIPGTLGRLEQNGAPGEASRGRLNPGGTASCP